LEYDIEHVQIMIFGPISDVFRIRTRDLFFSVVLCSALLLLLPLFFFLFFFFFFFFLNQSDLSTTDRLQIDPLTARRCTPDFSAFGSSPRQALLKASAPSTWMPSVNKRASSGSRLPSSNRYVQREKERDETSFRGDTGYVLQN
jgi:hypothetical protein